MTLKVVMVGTDKLKPARDNPRIHSKEQIAKLVNSIEQYGFTQPILAVGTEVVAGHGRLQAAKKLKMKTVPVIKLDNLSDTDKRIAYMIADNKIALEASWDLNKLNRHLKRLSKSIGVDVTGFSEEDMQRLEDDLAEQALSNRRGTSGGVVGGGGGSGGSSRSSSKSSSDDSSSPWRGGDDLAHLQVLMDPDHRTEVMTIVREHADKRGILIGEALYEIVSQWSKGKGKTGGSRKKGS